MTHSGGPAPAGGAARSGLPAGASLVELAIVLGLAAVMMAMGAPLLAAAADAGRAREAAQYLAAQCRAARMDAISRAASSGLVFSQVGGRWRFQRCTDGNGNGLRRADIASGRDTCGPPIDPVSLFRGVAIDVLPGLPDPDAGTATTGPVRFGSADMASFAPEGSATSGTVYLRSPGGSQFAVRVAGVTGRTRVLRYDPTTRRWSEA